MSTYRRLIAAGAAGTLALGLVAGITDTAAAGKEKERVSDAAGREKERVAPNREKERVAGREKERVAGREKERVAGREKE